MLPFGQNGITEQAKFTYSPIEKGFGKQGNTIEGSKKNRKPLKEQVET